MKKYRVIASWRMATVKIVECHTIEEAKALAEERLVVDGDIRRGYLDYLKELPGEEEFRMYVQEETDKENK